MKIAIVGPSHPYKGGIAKHTTRMAHNLTAAGHHVTLFSWKHQYPFFYPGQQFVPNNEPEVPIFTDMQRVLSWRSPLSWLQTGRKLRGFDKIILVWWVPTIQGPVYSTMLKVLGRKTDSLLLCHNVLPHEPRTGDTQLAKLVSGQVEHVLVHSEAQAEVARKLTTKAVTIAALPPVFPPKSLEYKPPATTRRRLLFFGLVRPYKGLDVLLKALVAVPGVHLTVAGEIWGEDSYQPLAESLGIAERVTFINRYIADEDLQDLFANADAAVLPYRGGTATFNVAYAHYFGLPVVATRTASMDTQVKDGVDGLLCDPDDVSSLTAALIKLYEKGTLEKLRRKIPQISDEAAWTEYTEKLLSDH